MYKKILQGLKQPINDTYFDMVYKQPKKLAISQYLIAQRGHLQADLMFYRVGSNSILNKNEYILVVVDMMKPYKREQVPEH